MELASSYNEKLGKHELAKDSKNRFVTTDNGRILSIQTIPTKKETLEKKAFDVYNSYMPEYNKDLKGEKIDQVRVNSALVK
jgi:hypothetical protein